MKERVAPYHHIESYQLSEAPVPLIAPTLEILTRYGLNPLTEWAGYYADQANRRHAESYLLSLACRHIGDQTGILGPLIGVSQGPEDTRQILTTIEQQLLGKMSDSLRQKVFAALTGGSITDTETVLTVDKLLGEAVTAVRQVGTERDLANPKLRNMTEKAYDFLLKNRLQLYQLIKAQDNHQASIFDLLKRKEIRGGFRGERLINITQQPTIPVIPEERAQLLQSILPEEINRQINPQPPEIDEPLGFVSRLNMAGSDMFRFLAGSLREKLKAQEMRELVSTMP